MTQKVLIGSVTTILLVLVLQLSTWEEKKPSKIDDISLDPMFEMFIERYEEHFRERLKVSKTPGAALVIVKDSTIVFAKGFGYRAEDSRDRVNLNTVFRIGSLSKSFAAALTAILTEEQELGWNDKVIEYLPDFALSSKEQTERLMIWHLLSHTTGLPTHAYTNLLDEGVSRERINEEFPKVKLNGIEGQTFGYQNAAFALIEDVIFSATGKKYEDQVVDKVLIPMRMYHSSASYDAMMSEPNKAFPHEYNYNRKEWRRIDISDKYYSAVSAGGINASIMDMGRYLKMLLGAYPEIISEYSLNTIFTPIVSTDSERNYYDNWKSVDASYYGLGWRIHIYDSDTIIHHGGYVNGYRSELAIYPSEKLGVCALYNASSFVTGRAVPDFLDLYNLYKAPVHPDTLMIP